jgi:hypothetical protein
MFLLLLPVSGVACAHRPPAAAPPPPPVVAEPAPPVTARPARVAVSVCQIENGKMTDVAAEYDPATGDTLYQGRPLRETLPVTPQPATAMTWYAAEPIFVLGHRYFRYGLPRRLGANDVVPSGEYEGVRYFVERAYPNGEVVYIPVSSNCEFQPYQMGEIGGAVRGLQV